MSARLPFATSVLLRIAFCILFVVGTARADEPKGDAPKTETAKADPAPTDAPARAGEIPKEIQPAPDADPTKKLAELTGAGKSVSDFLRTADGVDWLMKHAVALADDKFHDFRSQTDTDKFKAAREALLPELKKLAETDPFFRTVHDFIECMS